MILIFFFKFLFRVELCMGWIRCMKWTPMAATWKITLYYYKQLYKIII